MMPDEVDEQEAKEEASYDDTPFYYEIEFR